MKIQLSELREAAAEFARLGGEATLKHFKKSFQLEFKEDAETALKTSLDIVAEWINESVEVRDTLRGILRRHGVLSSEKNPAVTERTNFEDYYEFKSRVSFLKPHQTLALNRGERENILFVNVLLNDDITLDNLDDVVISNDMSIFTPYLQDAVEDAYKRLLLPSLERELRNELTDQADEHAIQTFATNLKNLLMQPPLKDQMVMGIDPGGCRPESSETRLTAETGTHRHRIPP